MIRQLRAALILALTGCALGATPALALAQDDGSFPVTFTNQTDGRWHDDQIYVTGIGQTTPGQWSYLKPDGTMARLDHTMADAPGHLTHDGRNYANMSFTLAQKSTVQIPPHVQGGRLYISVGKPLYIGVASDDSGYTGLSPESRADPNYDTVYDWYEFTYEHGKIPFGGNTTQVDQFGLPLTARLQQTASGTDRRTGITLSRAQVFAKYEDAVSKPFRTLDIGKRILSPRTAPAFADGGEHGDYLDPVIDRAWTSWKSGFSLTRLNQTFAGQVGSDGRLAFSQDGAGEYFVAKPTSQDVFRCNGALADTSSSTQSGVLGAELCAAFNRGVWNDTADWYRPSAYYDAKIDNGYSGFFHTINAGRRAYAFPYDDVNDQSSVTILPNSEPPTRLTIGVGW
jgi:hypothetical protein